MGDEQISYCDRIALGDFADDRRSGAQDTYASAEHFQLRGLDVNLNDRGHWEVICEPVQRYRGYKLRGSHTACLSSSEAVEVTSGTVAPRNVKPSDSNLVGERDGQDIDRCAGMVSNRRSAKQSDEQSIRLKRENVPARTCGHC
jgi:hypothetical protein